MDTRWRKKLVHWSKAPKAGKVLDCATGTGALAFAFQKQLTPEAEILGVDFCQEMLEQARIALKAQNHSPQKLFPPRSASSFSPGKNIHFQKADMNKLPFSNQSFDVCSCAYGLRNVENPLKALREMIRVTKTEGVVMILETGDKPGFLLYPFFHFYFLYVVPWIGGRMTGQKAAYEYLQKSSRNFPSRKELIKQIKKLKGVHKAEYKSLFFGASFIYKIQVSHK